MLYHVRITIESESSDETKVDLSFDELDRLVLEPYRTGRPITINGRTISLGSIDRIRISKSEEPASSVFPRLEAEDQASSVLFIGGPDYEWRAADCFEDVTDEFITGPPGSISPTTAAVQSRADDDRAEDEATAAGNRVFVVSGRDHTARRAITSLLQALGLIVVEWEHAVAKTGLPNPYVGDVVEAGLRMASAAVVIITPDDLVRLRDDLQHDDDGPDEIELQGQARPNVIYEAGFADAIGRDRTVLIEIGKVKSFSDATGRHVVRYDGSAPKRNALADRLALAGLAVDKTGDEWLEVGDVDEVIDQSSQAIKRALTKEPGAS